MLLLAALRLKLAFYKGLKNPWEILLQIYNENHRSAVDRIAHFNVSLLFQPWCYNNAEPLSCFTQGQERSHLILVRFDTHLPTLHCVYLLHHCLVSTTVPYCVLRKRHILLVPTIPTTSHQYSPFLSQILLPPCPNQPQYTHHQQSPFRRKGKIIELLILPLSLLEFFFLPITRTHGLKVQTLGGFHLHLLPWCCINYLLLLD